MIVLFFVFYHKERVKSMKQQQSIKLSGMALFNGLMIGSKKREAIGKKEKDDIVIEVEEKVDDKQQNIILKVPIVRGIFQIIYMMKNASSYLITSAKNVLKEYIEDEEEITNKEIILAFAIALLLIALFLTSIPNLVSSFFAVKWQIMVQITIQIIFFLVYLGILQTTKLLRPVFEYHGAEHKVIQAYERFGKEGITQDNVKNSSRFHVRCGGNLIVYFMIGMLITTVLLNIPHLLIKTIIQIVMIPILFGVSYEVLLIFSKLPKVFSYPAMCIQWITTREPDIEKLQLAMLTLNASLQENPITLEEALAVYLRIFQTPLKEQGICDIANILNQDTYRLIAKVKGIESSKISTMLFDITLNINEQLQIYMLLNKWYIEKIPLQYLLGKQAFYQEEYMVNPDVLIPRADTEILVETAISYINNHHLENVIDLCTGSGCVGISIACHSIVQKVFLSDISFKALEVANQNIRNNGVENKCFAVQSDLLQVFIDSNHSYDMIVSNPPYIPTSVISTLEETVQNEPKLALDGGESGIIFYERILEQASLVLADNGYLIFEIGYDQQQALKTLVSHNTQFEWITCIKDYGNQDRVVICRFHQK